MTRHSTSSETSVIQRNYKKLSEIQAELAEALPSQSKGWSAYWDSYAREVVELPKPYSIRGVGG